MGLRAYECADLPADGGQVNIKDWTFEDLVRVGAINVYIDTNGALRWKWKASTAGVYPVTEASGSAIASYSAGGATATVCGLPFIAANPGILGVSSTYHARRLGVKEITLAAGSASDQALVAALAGYYGVIQLVYMITDATDTYTFTFQDEDNNALTGLMGGVCAVTLTQQVINKTIEGAILYKGTDNKALEVDITGGAGVEKITIGYIYWYET